MTSAQVDQLTERLQQLLDAAADDRTRQYWERYLKGTRPVPRHALTGIRTAVRTLWHTEQLSGWPTRQLLALARHRIGPPFREDKLAATLLLAEHLAGRLTLEDGDALARPLAEGQLADWSSCDWYATKALHAYLTAAQLLSRQQAPGAGGAGHIDDRGEAVASRDGADLAAHQGWGGGGRSGSTTAHSSSGTSSSRRAVMARDHPIPL